MRQMNYPTNWCHSSADMKTPKRQPELSLSLIPTLTVRLTPQLTRNLLTEASLDMRTRHHLLPGQLWMQGPQVLQS